MIGPIRRSVTVAVDPERAFRAFTRDVATWWDLTNPDVLAPDSHQARRPIGRGDAESQQQRRHRAEEPCLPAHLARVAHRLQPQSASTAWRKRWPRSS